MTDQQHPITIPPDLEEELLGLWPQEALQRAAQWGANQELDACCEWIADNSLHHAQSDLLNDLRAARRPQPKSLAEEALEAVTAIKNMADDYKQFDQDVDIIHRALERLQELEGRQ